MKPHKISSMHCGNCAKTLEARLQALDGGDTIRLDYAHDTLHTPPQVNMDDVKKVLASEKIVILDDSQSLVLDSHDHHHHHHDTSSRNIMIVFVMNVIFSISEFFFGALFNSTAIISDAIHDFGDALSIGLAWIFEKVSSKEANSTFSFGHRRFSLLGALITATVLIIGSIFSIVRSVPRLFNPEAVNYEGMFWLAIAAIIMNLIGTWLLHQGSSKNEKILSLHLLEDVLGWVSILVVSIILRFTPLYILDPILAIGLAIFILVNALPSFIEAVTIFLEAVPKDVSMDQVKGAISKIEGIHALSHFHFWSIDGHENAAAITVYTTTKNGEEHTELREKIRLIFSKANVTHSTIEVVYDPTKLITFDDKY